MSASDRDDCAFDLSEDLERLDWPEYRYLAPWLRTALWGLSTDARARLREEIGSHFHDALEEGLRRGLSEEAAGKRAVESLGSPLGARLRFHCTYLTALEQRQLERIRHLDRWALVVFWLICASNAVDLFTEPRWSWPHWELRAALVAAGAVALLAIGAMSTLARKGHVRAAIVVAAVAYPTFYTSWASQHRVQPLAVGFELVPAVVLFGLFSIGYLSLFLKLPPDTERA